VRAEAARALEGIERDPVVAALATALFDPDDEVRDAAALSLRELKDPALGVHLLPLATSDDAFVRAAALRALRPLRPAESLQPALTALDAAESAVRREAVGVLG
jgi:HEAT repeat protein